MNKTKNCDLDWNHLWWFLCFCFQYSISGTNLNAQSSCEQNSFLQHAWWHNRTSTSLKHQSSRWLKQYSQVSFSLKDPAIISFTSSNDNLTSARMSIVQKSCELGNPVASNAFSQTTSLAIAYGHLLAIRDIRIPTLVTRSFYRVLHLRAQAPTIGSKETHACSLAIFHPCC